MLVYLIVYENVISGKSNEKINLQKTHDTGRSDFMHNSVGWSLSFDHVKSIN